MSFIGIDDDGACVSRSANLFCCLAEEGVATGDSSATLVTGVDRSCGNDGELTATASLPTDCSSMWGALAVVEVNLLRVLLRFI